MDIVGPFTTSHVHGFKWILVVVDDHSRYKLIKLLKHKSEANEKADEFLATTSSLWRPRKQTAPVNIIGNVKCDNVGEFLSRDFPEMLTDKGIHVPDVTPPACPPAERRR